MKKTGRFLFYLTFFCLLGFVLNSCANTTPAPADFYETIQTATLTPGQAIPAPQDEVILTVSGNIANSNVNNTAQFDRATLESIGLIEYNVEDPFAREDRVFAGVPMSDLLDVVGASPEAESLRLVALNDYAIEIDIGIMDDYPIIFALTVNGQDIPDDDGGPAIIVFPLDDYEELTPIEYGDYWVWSMAEIEVQ